MAHPHDDNRLIGAPGRLAARAAIVALTAALPIAPAIADSPFDYKASVRSTYTSNPFHYSDRQLDRFDRNRDVGERFQQLDSKSDVVNRLRIEADYDRKIAPKRDLTIELGLERHIHVENGIADYTRLEFGLGVEATRKDEFHIGIEYIPDRFKKNYLIDRVGGSKVFDAAFLDQTDVAVGYERKVRKHWRAGATWHRRDRQYDDRFGDRDLDGDYVELSTKYRIRKGLQGRTGLVVGDVMTGVGRDLGVRIDRSYEQQAVFQEFDWRIAKGHELEFGVQLRRRDFQTSVSDDLARFGREDDRIKAHVSGEHVLRGGLSLLWRVVGMDNDTDSKDPTAEADEIGYEEIEAGIGLAVRF